MDGAPQGPTVTIKPLGGIAGDMFAGACAALWPELAERCLADVRAAGLPADVDVGFEEVSVNGFAARRFRVGAAGSVVPTGAYPEIVARLEASAVDRAVLAQALAILRRLGEAEARVHGKPLERVHFHELADWDSVADIVAAASFIARGPAAGWRIGPLPVGGGSVNTQHGRITVPAPAVLRLLEGHDFVDDGIAGERVTPTGAAIVAHLTEPDAPPPTGRLVGSGFGAGEKRFEGLANVVQLVAFRPVGAAAVDAVTEISFDIDDMTPEELAVAVDRLRSAEGVLDVTQTATIGKKGRAAVLVRVLCACPAAEAVAELCLSETSTLGVRLVDMRRRVLDRRLASVRGTQVKLSRRPDGAATAKAESDHLAPTPTLAARRRQAREAETEALGSGPSDD